MAFGFEEGKTDELDTSNKRTENREGGGYVCASWERAYVLVSHRL